MKFISLFSGIGGFDLGLTNVGMQCVCQVEIDKAARGVLATHYPHVERLTDVTKAGKDNLPTVDLICGGFPCQDLSLAGRRAGLDGERSGLWFEFARIIGELNPSWVLIENVPSLLSSNEGRDFKVILDGLVERGYGVCWRVLDAQYFGLAQRRKRLFIVASLGNGRSAQVLFERESRNRDIEPRRTSGYSDTTNAIDGIANALTTKEGMRYEPTSETYIVGTLAASGAGSARPAGQMNEASFLVFAQNQRKELRDLNDKAVALNAETGMNAQTFIAFTPSAFAWHAGATRNMPVVENLSPTLTVSDHTPMGVHETQGVRRLTPTECERLQGFPDGWTLCSNGKPQADSARYKQLGNAVAVPVVEWIARRIMVNSEHPHAAP